MTASRGLTIAADEPLLWVKAASKSYGGVQVLDRVDIEFRPGEVHALLGENGAGKSTLVKVAAGIVSPDGGEVGGPAVANSDVAMVFQELSVVPEMSILDNLVIAGRRRGLMVPYRRLTVRANDVLVSAGLSGIDVRMPVSALSLAQRQLLEIACGLMRDARLLILDEPTATLSDVEIERVHAVIRSLVERGHGVVYITHRLGEVFSIADSVTIMRSGRVAASGPVSNYSMGEVIAHMLGSDHVPVDKRVSGAADTDASKLLEVHQVSSRGRLHSTSFDIAPGSVLALFGQIGSGADALVRMLAGLERLDEGVVTLGGRPLRFRNRAQTQKDGIAYVSADRVSEGVFLDASVVANISSGALSRVCSSRIIRRAKERELAVGMAKAVSLDGKRIRENVYALSGGNQQKVAVAKALATQPRVLLLNEPTRGVDIGARSEIYRSIRQLLVDDVIVIAYSSDVVEIRELADQVITMYRGRLVGRHQVDEVSDSDLISEILNGDPVR